MNVGEKAIGEVSHCNFAKSATAQTCENHPKAPFRTLLELGNDIVMRTNTVQWHLQGAVAQHATPSFVKEFHPPQRNVMESFMDPRACLRTFDPLHEEGKVSEAHSRVLTLHYRVLKAFQAKTPPRILGRVYIGKSIGKSTLKGTSILDCGTAVHEGSGAPLRAVGAWFFAGTGFPLDTTGGEAGADTRSADQGLVGAVLSANVISVACKAPGALSKRLGASTMNFATTSTTPFLYRWPAAGEKDRWGISGHSNLRVT